MTDKKSSNSAAPIIAGAIIGAAATAAAITLSDKKKRTQLQGKVDELRKMGTEQLKNMRKSSQETLDELSTDAKQAVHESINHIETKLDAAEKELDDKPVKNGTRRHAPTSN